MDITYPRSTKGPENRSSNALSHFRAPPSPGAPPWGTDPFEPILQNRPILNLSQSNFKIFLFLITFYLLSGKEETTDN